MTGDRRITGICIDGPLYGKPVTSDADSFSCAMPRKLNDDLVPRSDGLPSVLAWGPQYVTYTPYETTSGVYVWKCGRAPESPEVDINELFRDLTAGFGPLWSQRTSPDSMVVEFDALFETIVSDATLEEAEGHARPQRFLSPAVDEYRREMIGEWSEPEPAFDSRGRLLGDPHISRHTSRLTVDDLRRYEIAMNRPIESLRRVQSQRTSPDSMVVEFDLERTKVCWKKVNGLECGEPSDDESETGLCSGHRQAIRDKYASPKRERKTRRLS